jgi:two-component system LytT family response regulator
MTIRTLVIDDEPIARRSIVRLLAEDDAMQLVGECGDGASALDAIRAHRPDLVFLDVQMPEMSGIDVVNAMHSDVAPAIVFVTAYERYAVQAFDIEALDYLVKPFSRERFFQTVERAKRHLAGRAGDDTSADVLRAVELLRRGPEYAQRLSVPVDEHLILVDVASIDWIEANRNSVRLHVGKDVYTLRQTMTHLASRLDPSVFLRVHRSAMVNIHRIKTVHPWFNGYHLLVLSTGQQLRMSRYQHQSFLQLTGRQK